MKKYNMPAIKVIKIETRKMLAESVGFNSTPVDAGQATGRGGFYFEEDEE